MLRTFLDLLLFWKVFLWASEGFMLLRREDGSLCRSRAALAGVCVDPAIR
jgi:hypothetical protein